MPMQRAAGSTISSRSWAVSPSLRTQKIEPTGRPEISAIQAALAVRVVVAGVVGDHARHEGLEARVPAVLGVERAVALDDPAVVAGLGRAEHERGGAGHVLEDLAHRRHRVEEPAAVGVAEPVEEGADLRGGARVEGLVGDAAGVRELEALAPAVVGRALAGDEALLLDPREQTAQVAAVEVEDAPQVGGVDASAAAELEQHARLGERVRRREEPVAQRADAGGVEAVEGAHGLDLVGRRAGGCGAGRRHRRA